MLKPNYGRPEISSNYKIGYGFGNNYFEGLKSQGIVDLILNGQDVRIIPQYDFSRLPFPPQSELLTELHTNESEFRNVHERRYYSFYFVEFVLFEYPEKAGTFQKLIFEDYGDREPHNCLVYFLTTDEYQRLVKEIRSKMPWIPSKRNLRHHIRKDDISDLYFVQFVDALLHKLKDHLSDDIRKALML